MGGKSSVMRTRKAEPLKRYTFYLRPSQAKALKIQAAETGRDTSAILRDLLDQHLAGASAKRKVSQ